MGKNLSAGLHWPETEPCSWNKSAGGKNRAFLLGEVTSAQVVIYRMKRYCLYKSPFEAGVLLV